MIGTSGHVEIDGTVYYLAEDADGTHHNIVGEPLRPPNAVTVQGEQSQKFQVRPEVLLWNWTDWSGGEGQRVFNAQAPNRAWELNGVRAFEEPGKLIPGYYIEETQDSTGAADIEKTGELAVGTRAGPGPSGSAALFLRTNSLGGAEKDFMYEWVAADEKWDGGTDLSQSGLSIKGTMIGDPSYVYWSIVTGSNVSRWNGSAVSSITLSPGVSGAPQWAQTEDYLYAVQTDFDRVNEIAKSGSGNSDIDSWETDYSPVGGVAVLAGRIYFALVGDTSTIIREITPTSAAGPGFGKTIATIEGFLSEGMWAHSGKVFLIGSYRDPQTERTILYIQPGGTYGSLGELRPGHDLGLVHPAGGRMLDHFFVVESLSAAQATQAVFQIDSVSGGIACVGYDEADAVDATLESAAVFNGEVFWAAGSTTQRIFRARTDQYMINSSAISPEHDFDLVSDKFLSSFVLSCEALPADWSVYVDYQINGSGSWVNAIDYSTTSGTGTTATITTDSSTVEFNRLQLRIRFEYTGAGVPTSAPKVTGVEARSVVAEKVRVARLLLNLADDHSGDAQSLRGAAKVDLFQATVAKKVSVDFKDGYTSRLPATFDQYDVFVDDYNIVLDRPGEGVGAITLREVI